MGSGLRSQGSKRYADPKVGKDGRVDAGGEIAQFADRLRDARPGLSDELLRACRVGAELLLSHPEAEPERDQARLGAVVEVALDPPQLGVLLLDRASPARLEHLDPGRVGRAAEPGPGNSGRRRRFPGRAAPRPARSCRGS